MNISNVLDAKLTEDPAEEAVADCMHIPNTYRIGNVCACKFILKIPL